MIAILDYGAGNLKSALHAIEAFDKDVAIFDQAAKLPSDLKGVVLPGDGSFPYAFDQLKQRGFVEFIHAHRELPLLGICVGFQLLFSESEEDGGSEGLNLIQGKVRKFPGHVGKIPHMGWNQPTYFNEQSPYLKGVSPKDYFYFVHSYYATCDNQGLSLVDVEYGVEFCAGVCQGKIVGFQFHPEKSHKAGWKIVENFVKQCE